MKSKKTARKTKPIENKLKELRKTFDQDIAVTILVDNKGYSIKSVETMEGDFGDFGMGLDLKQPETKSKGKKSEIKVKHNYIG